jgi:hypothetical protein
MEPQGTEQMQHAARFDLRSVFEDSVERRSH